MTPDDELNKLCATLSLRDAISGQPLARERIIEELKKLFILAKKPSQGLWWLVSINRLNDLFPVTHTSFMLNNQATAVFKNATAALDKAAEQLNTLRKKNNLDASLHFGYLLAAFLASQVDSTKNCTKEAVTPIIKQLITPLTDDHHLVKFVATLVLHQATPTKYVATNTPAVTYKKLAWELEPLISLRQLTFFSSLINTELVSTNFLLAAEKAGVADHAEKPVLSGNDLMDSVPAGPLLGELLRASYVYQLEHDIKDPEILKEYALQKFNTPKKP